MVDLPWKKKDKPVPPTGSPPEETKPQTAPTVTPPAETVAEAPTDQPITPGQPPAMTSKPLGPPPSPLDQTMPAKKVEKETERIDPEAPPVPPPSLTEAPVMAKETKKSKMPLIIGVVIIVNLIIWAFVGYNYYQNQKLKEEVEEREGSATGLTVTLPPATPTPATIIKIENGNVTKVASSGEKTVIVDKEDYQGTGITGFTNVEVSPDNQKVCFWSLPPALSPALYYSDIEGAAVVKIRERAKDCKWSNDNNKIAYVDDTSLETAVNIYVYDLLSKEETNLTSASTTTTTYRRYSITSWLENDTKITCRYEEMGSATPAASTTGVCEINVTTSEVSDL